MYLDLIEKTPSSWKIKIIYDRAEKLKLLQKARYTSSQKRDAYFKFVKRVWPFRMSGKAHQQLEFYKLSVGECMQCYNFPSCVNIHTYARFASNVQFQKLKSKLEDRKRKRTVKCTKSMAWCSVISNSNSVQRHYLLCLLFDCSQFKRSQKEYACVTHQHWTTLSVSKKKAVLSMCMYSASSSPIL